VHFRVATRNVRDRFHRRALRPWLSFSSFHPLRDPVGDPQRVRDDGERGVHRADRGKEAGIGEVEVVEFVCLSVEIEH
jgi:hypothetical protein